MHRSSFSRHDSFFSSLSRVEKRLASEKEAEEAEPSSSSSSSFPSSSSSSPLFLLSNAPEPIHHEATANIGSSEPPLDFLSNSPTTQFQQQQQQQAPDDGDDHQVDDDIDRLVSLLGLSLPPHQNDHYSSCDCSSCSQGGGGGGFFRKVVGVKGPRCGKEMERLDAWINTLYSSSSQSKSKREPARLAHLLLGKAAAVALNDAGDDGFGAVGFPATVHDFLDHDPPQEKEE